MCFYVTCLIYIPQVCIYVSPPSFNFYQGDNTAFVYFVRMSLENITYFEYSGNHIS